MQCGNELRHRIAAENAWMFGEQCALSVDDQPLSDVLKSMWPRGIAKGENVESDYQPVGHRL